MEVKSMRLKRSRLMSALLAGCLSVCIMYVTGHVKVSAFADEAGGASAEEHLLFHVSYNGQSPRADFAGGNADSTNFTRNLQYLTAPGVSGIGLQTEDNESCNYEMKGNYDPEEGSLGIWVRPENWRPSEGRPYVFFAAEIPGRYRMLLCKNAGSPDLVYEVSLEDPEKETCRVRYNVGFWRPKEWHKVDVTWSATNLKLYIDGDFMAPKEENREKEKESWPARETFAFPEAEAGGYISINPNNYFKGRQDSTAADKTVVDEIKVYGRARSAEQIKKAFIDVKTALSGGVYRRPLVTVPFDETPVKLDGKIGEEEWAAAAKVPIQHLQARRDYANHFGDVRLKYDGEHLYFGFHARGEKSPLTRHKERDAYLWQDAAFEFVWQTAEPTKAAFQFIINSANAVWDAKNNNIPWNGVNATAAGLDGDGWSAEVALNFKEIGVEAPKEGTAWGGNFMHDWDQRRGGYATWGMAVKGYETFFSDATMFGTIRFGARNPGIRIDALGNLPLGDVDASVSLSSLEGASPRTAQFKLSSEEGVPQELGGELRAGESIGFQAIADLGAENLFSVTVKDGAGVEELVFDQIFHVKPPILLAYKCWPHLKRLDVDLDLTNMDEDAKALMAKGALKGVLSLVSPDERALSFVEVAPKEITSTWALPFGVKMPPGMYSVKVTFPSPFGGEYQQQRPFEVPPDTPFVVKSGVNHDVPDPWTPIEVDADSAKILDRRYSLGRSPFPVKMVSLGIDIFARPIALVLETDKGKEDIEWSTPEVVEKFPDEVTFKGEGKATKSGLQLAYDAKLEFDGQWLVNLTLAPGASPAGIRSLRLEYALAPEAARYVKAPLVCPWEGDEVDIEMFDTVVEAPTRLSSRGYFWVTGLKAGLSFFTTTNGNWVLKAKQPNVHIRRKPKAVDVEINIIDQAVVLEKKASYVFGFTATPPKRTPPKNFLSGDHGYIFQDAREKWENWVSLVHLEPERLKKRMADKREKEGCLFYYQYSAPAMVTGDNPYEDYWGATWVPNNDYKESVNMGCCPNSSFRDLICYQAENLARDFGIGPYFDMCDVSWCDNKAHGCGYLDSFGREAKTMPTLGFRDELKRIYKITHANGCRLWNHNHSVIYLPHHTFADLWFPGEQYASRLVGDDHFYTGTVPRTDYLVEMNPFIHGMTMVFLPEYGRGYDLRGYDDFRKWQEDDDYIWATEEVLAMILPHNIDFISAYMNPKPGRKVADVYREEGVAKRLADKGSWATFVGYWDNPRITPSDPEVMLSYYAFPDEDKVLAVVSNPALQPKTITLDIDGKALGLRGPLTVRDEYRGENLPGWEKGITIPNGSFRLLLIRPAAGK
jgi:hypothetical protein